MINNQILISRYKEDMSWLNKIINHEHIENIIIYNKGPSIYINHPKITIQNMDNVGREGLSYLDYIIDNYENLPENIWMIQANPIEHSQDFINLLNYNSFLKYKDSDFIGLTVKWVGEIPPSYMLAYTNIFDINNFKRMEYLINIYDMQLIGHCRFFDHGLANAYNDFYKKFSANYNSMINAVCDYIGINKPKYILRFNYSACFFVKKDSILKNTKETYIKLKNFLLYGKAGDEPEGYVLERMWDYIFTHRSYDTITQYYNEVINFDYGAIYNQYKNSISIFKNYKKYIYENNDSILLIKQNNEIKYIYGLNFYGELIREISCDNFLDAQHICKNILK